MNPLDALQETLRAPVVLNKDEPQILKSVPFDSLVDDQFLCLTKKKEQKSYLAECLRKNVDPDTRSAGDRRYAAMKEMFDSTTGYMTVQRDCLNDFAKLVASHVYDEDFGPNRMRLLWEHGWARDKSGMFVTAPRQFGKTFFLSHAVCAYLASVKSKNVAIISNRLASGKDLLAKIADRAEKFPELKGRMKRTKSELLVANPDVPSSMTQSEWIAAGLFNRVRVIAANNNNKGFNADLIILEEAGRIPAKVIEELIAPLFKVRNCKVVAISTKIHTGLNWFTNFLTNPAREYAECFIRVQYDLECKECGQDARKLLNCHHNDWKHPPWNQAQNARIAQMFMFDQAIYAREVLGIAMAEGHSGVLNLIWIEELKNLPTVEVSKGVIYSFVDPANGGKSDWAIVTITCNPDGVVAIVGMCRFNVRQFDRLRDSVCGYMSQFPVHREYAFCPHAVMIERNSPGDSFCDLLTQIALRSAGNRAMEIKTDGRHGLWTDYQSKQGGVSTLAVLMLKKKIAFATEVITCGDLAATKAEFFSQLSHLRQEQSGVHKSYTGKGEGNDDIAMSLALVIDKAMKCGMRLNIDEDTQRLSNHFFL
jgi:hypothetical protein